jgi:hypothetical protein
MDRHQQRGTDALIARDLRRVLEEISEKLSEAQRLRTIGLHESEKEIDHLIAVDLHHQPSSSRIGISTIPSTGQKRLRSNSSDDRDSWLQAKPVKMAIREGIRQPPSAGDSGGGWKGKGRAVIEEMDNPVRDADVGRTNGMSSCI